MNQHYFQTSIPFDISFQVPIDNSVKLLETIINSLDLSKLHVNYSRSGRKPNISKHRMVMILIYAYMEGIYSSRDIEEKLNRDTHYMYLANYKTVSHSRINEFRKSLTDDVFLDLYKQFVLTLKKLNEITFESLYIDGTKIEANANKYTFVWKNTVLKNEIKLQLKIKELIKEINDNNEVNINIEINEKVTVEQISKILEKLYEYVSKNHIIFTKGKGNRKTIIQKQCEKLEEYLYKQYDYDEANSIFDGRNSYSKTDKTATFMRMKEDHMKNGQLKEGYNVQVALEGGYVIAVDVFNNRNDIGTLKPFLDSIYNLYKIRPKNCINDSGYASEKNYAYLDNNNIKYYIPYQTYYIEQTIKFKNDISKRENMKYNAEKDVYICANNQELIYTHTSTTRLEDGYEIKKKNYQGQNCSNCPLREKCMPKSKKDDSNKQISYSEQFEIYKKQALENIKSEEGIIHRINRSIQTEGFFGILKQDYNFRRFMLRGTEKVKLEMLLLCFAYNMRKLNRKIMQDKLGIMTVHGIKENKVIENIEEIEDISEQLQFIM